MPSLQLVELFEGQGIDWAKQTKLTFELTNTPGWSRSVGNIRHLSGLSDRWFNIKFTAQCLDCCFKTQLRLSFLEFRFASLFSGHIERLFLFGSVVAQRFKLGRESTNLVALFATLLSQTGVVTFYDKAMPLDECGKPIDYIDLTLDDKPLTLRSDASFFVCFKTTLGLVETTFIELLAFLQTSKSDLDVTAARRQQSRASFKIGPELSPRSRCFRLGLLVALERWEERLDVGDPLLLTFDVEFCLGDVSVECFEFSLDFTLLPLSSRQAF